MDDVPPPPQPPPPLSEPPSPHGKVGLAIALAVVGVAAALFVVTAGRDRGGSTPETEERDESTAETEAAAIASLAGLDLAVPEGWTTVESTDTLLVSETGREVDDPVVYGARITVSFSAADEDPADVLAAGLDDIAAADAVSDPSAIRADPSAVRVAGFDAVSMTVDLTGREGTLHDAVRRLVVIPITAGTYVLTFDVHRGQADELAPTFDAVLDSIRIDA